MRVDAERDSRWLNSSAFPFTVYQKVYLTEIVVSVVYMVKGISSLILAATMNDFLITMMKYVIDFRRWPELVTVPRRHCFTQTVLLTNCKAFYSYSSKTAV